MFNNHTMSVVTDLNLISNIINNTDFVSIAAITDQYPNHPNIYNAAILIPPTELLMAWANNNPLIMQQQYPIYLQSKDPDDMIVALIAAMTKKNIILYIPKDEFNIFGQILLNHLYYVYGITCNFMNIQFSINPVKFPFIITKFYMIDVMDPNDFLAMYPGNQILPDMVIDKLAKDLHPFNHLASFGEYAKYFNELNAQKMKNKPLIDMVKLKEGRI